MLNCIVTRNTNEDHVKIVNPDEPGVYQIIESDGRDRRDESLYLVINVRGQKFWLDHEEDEISFADPSSNITFQRMPPTFRIAVTFSNES